MLTRKSEFVSALVRGGLDDLEGVRARLTKLPSGRHRLQSVGACPTPTNPAFLYACTADERIWLIADGNLDVVSHALALAHGGGTNPFPCTVTHADDLIRME